MERLDLTQALEPIADAFRHRLAAAPERDAIQLAVEVAPVDMLSWLQGQNETLQFFWTSRKRGFQVAALGAVRRWNDLTALEAELATMGQDLPELRCYGGWRFDAGHAAAEPWQDWPGSLFFWPRWELRGEKGHHRLILNLAGPRVQHAQELAEALQMLRAPAALPPEIPQLIGLEHRPQLAGWTEQINKAQAAFHKGELRKLVLSRVSKARLESLPLTLMQRLYAQGREAYHFWFRPMPDQVLWGASPERLYALTDGTLWTEALAGTRQRPQDPARQEALRTELLASHKEHAENEWVLQHLEHALAPLVSDLSADPLRVIPSGPVQHLYRCVQAHLSPGLSNARLVEALHPTPAVSGFPSSDAVARLRGIEAHDRGWYAGALGWVSPTAAEWSVVLRCALWKQGLIHFFTGAGIMPESEPAAEWQELNLKLSSLLALWDESDSPAATLATAPAAIPGV